MRKAKTVQFPPRLFPWRRGGARTTKVARGYTCKTPSVRSASKFASLRGGLPLKTVKVDKNRKMKDYAWKNRIGSLVRSSHFSTHSNKLSTLHCTLRKVKWKSWTTKRGVRRHKWATFVPVRKVAAAVKTERAGTRMQKKQLKTTQLY
jgi:hypothetical protein